MNMMNRFPIAAVRTLLGVGVPLMLASAARAEEATGGNSGFPAGQPPEYLHVLLHPVLIVGLGVALVALLAGLLSRSKAAQIIALCLVLGSSLAAWPVLKLGQSAYNRVRPQADEAGKAWAREHMRRAETFVYVFYGTALLATAGLLTHRKFAKAVMPLTIATLVAGAASLGGGGWISKAGGQIRHPEFRDSPPPIAMPPDHSHSPSKP